MPGWLRQYEAQNKGENWIILSDQCGRRHDLSHAFSGHVDLGHAIQS